MAEFYRELAAHRERDREDYERQVSLNYMLVAMWVDAHTKQGYQMKPLKKYLGGDGIDHTREGQWKALQAWSARLGTPIVTEAA